MTISKKMSAAPYLYSSPNYVIYNSIQLQESTKSNPRHSTHLTTHNKKFISLFTN